MKINRNLLYLSFHHSLKKKYGANRLVSKKEILIKLGRHFLVPKNLRLIALNEMEKLKLFRKENDKYYLILEGETDLDESPCPSSKIFFF